MQTLFEFCRILLAIDLTIWYVRLLHVALVFKNLGPKLVMIQKMVKMSFELTWLYFFIMIWPKTPLI